MLLTILLCFIFFLFGMLIGMFRVDEDLEAGSLDLFCVSTVQQYFKIKLGETISFEKALSISKEIVHTNFPKCFEKYVQGEQWKL